MTRQFAGRLTCSVCVWGLTLNCCFVPTTDVGAAPPSEDERKTARALAHIAAPQATLEPDGEDVPPITAEMQDGTEVTFAALDDITEPEKLSGLQINSGTVRDSDLGFLDRTPQLDLFALPGFWQGTPSEVTDAGFEKITQIRNVRYLSIASDHITDNGVAKLVALKKLVDLGIGGSQLTDHGIAKLAELTDLECLRLHVPQLTDKGLARFRALNKLHWLDVRGTRVCGTGFASLGNVKYQLEYIEGNFTDEGIEVISRLASSIQFMYIAGPQVTDAAVKHLVKIKSLDILLLEGTSVTDEGVRRLRNDSPWLTDVTRFQRTGQGDRVTKGVRTAGGKGEKSN